MDWMFVDGLSDTFAIQWIDDWYSIIGICIEIRFCSVICIGIGILTVIGICGCCE